MTTLLGDAGSGTENTTRLYEVFKGAYSVFQVVTQDQSFDWRPAEGNVVKVNYDGSWDEEGRAGTGVIVRDSAGVVVAVRAHPVGNNISGVEVEGLALKEGLKLAEVLCIEKAILEVECAQVVERLWGGNGALVKVMVGDKAAFQPWRLTKQWSINLIRREANSNADLLAKKACSAGWCWLRHDACPKIYDFVFGFFRPLYLFGYFVVHKKEVADCSRPGPFIIRPR